MKGDSKELEEKELEEQLIRAKVASYPDKSEEITSKENHGKFEGTQEEGVHTAG